MGKAGAGEASPGAGQFAAGRSALSTTRRYCPNQRCSRLAPNWFFSSTSAAEGSW